MGLRSSYKENNYGNVFQALILAQRPRLVLEFGVLDGYSTYHIASAIKFNHVKFNIICKFDSYDLWDKYRIKHGDWYEVSKMLKEKELDDYVMLSMGDAFDVNVANNYSDGAIDFMHMDISNNGDKLLKTLEVWRDKISPDGMIVFEGGSKERDNVEWMERFKFKPIQEALCDPHVFMEWEVKIFDPFPSLTLLWHRKKL